jgi:hypothetical protein
LTILAKRDRVDAMNHNIFRHFQRFLGASLYHCWRCRVQFYDLRSRMIQPKTEAKFVAST